MLKSWTLETDFSWNSKPASASVLFFFFPLKLHSHICENRSRSAEHLPSPSPVFYFLQHPQKKLGGKKPSGSVAASSVNVFVSNFWPTWCNSSRASVHKMLIRGWSETPSWTRTASDPLHVCKQGGKWLWLYVNSSLWQKNEIELDGSSSVNSSFVSEIYNSGLYGLN